MLYNTAFSDARISAAAFENRTIIIGTHAISLDGINEDIVSKAKASMKFKEGKEIKEQTSIYYKSDLSKGTWFDITSATSIQNVIDSNDKIVSKDVIDALKLTHYTNAKGATIEFATGKTVSTHDINDLAHPRNMLEELTGVDAQVDVVSGKRKMDYDMDDDDEDALKSALKKEYNLLNDVFDPISSGLLDDLSHKMDIFTAYIDYLKNDLKVSDEAVEAAVSIKSKLQTQYDIECYIIVKARIEDIAGKMNPNSAKESIDTLWAAVNKINSKVNTLEANLGGDAAGTTLYELQEGYIDDIYKKVLANQSDQTVETLSRILSVDRIYASKMIDIPLELTVLGEAQTKVLSSIQSLARQTDTVAYHSAKSSSATAIVLKSIMEDDLAVLKSAVEDAVSIKSFTAMRLDTDGEKSQTVKVILEGLKEADASLKADDDYYYDYHKILNDVIQSLENELAALNANQDPEIQGKQAELSELQATMKNLKEDYLEAVDQGDLELVDAIEQALNSLEEDINALQNSMTSDYQALMNKSLTENGLSDEDKASMMGLSTMMSALDQSKISDVNAGLEGLKSAIGREDIFGIQDSVDAYKLAKENVEDLLSADYLANLDQQVDDAFKGKYKAMIAQGRFQTASMLMDAVGDAVDTEAVTVGMDKGGADTLNTLLTQSETYRALLNEVASAKEKAASQKGNLEAYQISLDHYQSLEKQRLIVEILLRRALLSNDQYRGDVSLEGEKATYIQQLRQLDGQKYRPEDIKAIEAKEKQFAEDVDETMISALKVIVETYNVPLFNPILEIDGVYFIPTRTLSEAFGGRVQWLQDSQTAIIDYKGQHMVLYTGSKTIEVNDIQESLDNPVYLIEDKTYVAMDFIETYYRQLYAVDDEVFIVFSREVEDRVQSILGGE